MTQQSIYPGRGMLRHGLMAVEVEESRGRGRAAGQVQIVAEQVWL